MSEEQQSIDVKNQDETGSTFYVPLHVTEGMYNTLKTYMTEGMYNTLKPYKTDDLYYHL